MKSFVAVVIMFFVIVGSVAFGGENEPNINRRIDVQIAEAIAGNACASIDVVNAGEYFRQVFASEVSKKKWLERVISKARTLNPEIEGEAFVSDPEINLAPEPFIEIVLQQGVVYTFFKSGRVSCDFPKIRNKKESKIGRG